MAMFLRIARSCTSSAWWSAVSRRSSRSTATSWRRRLDPRNPEFTMLEFYQAYADYEDNMDLTEELFRELAQAVLGTTDVPYGDKVFHFGEPFVRLSVFDSILKYNPEITAADLNDVEKARAIAKRPAPRSSATSLGKLQVMIFEELVEHKLEQPPSSPATLRGFAAGPPQRRRPERHRPLRAVHRRPRDRQCLFRAERRRGPGRALHVAGQGEGRRRRRGDALRRRLHQCPGIRHAADRRRRHRHRPPGDAADQLAVDPRRDPVPAHAPAGLSATVHGKAAFGRFFMAARCPSAGPGADNRRSAG
ncbi:amino acid--tRNA ligase-related protein [Pseudomonas aeruginosa]